MEDINLMQYCNYESKLMAGIKLEPNETLGVFLKFYEQCGSIGMAAEHGEFPGTVVPLSEYGTMLGTKKLGQMIREKYHIGEVNIVLDFNGVKVVSNSFAKELVGRPAYECGLEQFMDKTAVINAHAWITSTLTDVIEKY